MGYIHMQNDFRLTGTWHIPRITYAPAAAVAPFGGASGRHQMATAERIERIDRDDRRKDAKDQHEERGDKERSKAVELAVGQIEKQFGKGSIMRLGGAESIAPIAAISTGSISIDWALGVGGLPRGRV